MKPNTDCRIESSFDGSSHILKAPVSPHAAAADQPRCLCTRVVCGAHIVDPVHERRDDPGLVSGPEIGSASGPLESGLGPEITGPAPLVGYNEIGPLLLAHILFQINLPQASDQAHNWWSYYSSLQTKHGIYC